MVLLYIFEIYIAEAENLISVMKTEILNAEHAGIHRPTPVIGSRDHEIFRKTPLVEITTVLTANKHSLLQYLWYVSKVF